MNEEKQFEDAPEELTAVTDGADGESVKPEAEEEGADNAAVSGAADRKKFLFIYIAIGCFSLGVIAFALAIGLTFVVKNVGIYLILTSMISELCAMTFINAQKKMHKTKLCLIFNILSYAVLIACVILIVTGTIAVTSCQNN